MNTSIRAFHTITLDEARSHLDDLDELAGVIPTHARDALQQVLEDLLQSAAALGLNTLGKFCTDAALVLTHVTALSTPVGPHRTADADRLHRYRNMALALALASGYYLDVDAPTVIGSFPALWARTQRTDRPHTDDEITLLRVHIADLLRRPSKFKLAGAYAMVDAGATPAETTGISADDFDDITDGHQPTYMLIPHQFGGIDDRAVDLDPFASYILGHVIRTAARRGVSENAPLTYTPGNGGRHSGSASVSRMLDRLHEALGIKQRDTTAASTRRWRIQTTFDTQGLNAAVAISGEKAARLPKLINLPRPAEDLDAAPIIRGFCDVPARSVTTR